MNFTTKEVATFCAKYKNIHWFSMSYYPQGNGQADKSSRTIIDHLYKNLSKAKGKWIDKLLRVLWVYRTTKHIPKGETPFSLAHGMEAIIPINISMPKPRTEEVELSSC